MKVFKFGGASVRDANNIKNVCSIIHTYGNNKLLVVISAMGKMTNALEKVIKNYYEKGKEEGESSLDQVKHYHTKEVIALFDSEKEILAELMTIFDSASSHLQQSDKSNFDLDYDQVVSCGELASTKIVFHYLQQQGIKASWLDARDVIQTDNTHREGDVDWKQTQSNIQQTVNDLFENSDVVITQGFIGRSTAGMTTTLGREGSDYTASIFSFCLDAESMSIWKDVPGILTGDPRRFENLTKIDRLSYKEAIEMTYYGAKVIHPKTIKPIQNKSIPLHVRSFIHPEGDGTMISDEVELNYPPVIVVEDNQALIHFSTKDFSFVAEHHLSRLFDLFTKHRIKVNMMRNTAISFTICTHENLQKLNALKEDLASEFKVVVDRGQELITVRHFNQQVVDELKKGKIVLFEERLSNTIQMVVKNVPVVKRK
jgi:aspartate kinase